MLNQLRKQLPIHMNKFKPFVFLYFCNEFPQKVSLAHHVSYKNGIH